jgi:Delta7-sterol 5-desaturase
MEFISKFIEMYIATSVYYLAFTVPFFVIFWWWLKDRLQSRRIQQKPRADKKQIFKELKNSFLTVLSITVVDTLIFSAGSESYIKIYTDISQYGWFYFVVTTFLLFVVDDTYFYWMHRLMHTDLLFKRVHKVHHESIDTTPFTSFSFHPFEAVLEQGNLIFIVLLSMFTPVHFAAIIIWQLGSMLLNVVGHLGYEIYPKWLLDTPILKWLAPTTHHNLHHTKFRGNYGLYFRWWDKIMGTEFDNFTETYRSIFERRTIGNEHK